MVEIDRIKERNQELADQECAAGLCRYTHYPEVLQIELTDRCNARCIMCKHYYKGNDGASDLASGVLERIEEYLPYCRLVLLNGYGESLISTHYRQCMDLLRKHRVKVFLTSNLSVFTDEMAQDAQDIFEQISVSCHGSNKADYERISQGLDFDRFTRNLEKLTSLPRPPRVALSVVAMAVNIAKAEEMIEFAARFHVPEVRYGRLGINRFLDNGELDLIHYEQAARYYFGKAREKADAFDIRLIYPENYHKPVTDPARLAQELEQLAALEFRYTAAHRDKMEQRYRASAAVGQYVREPQCPFETQIPCSGVCDWVARGMYIDKAGCCFSCCESREVCYGKIPENTLEEIRNADAAVQTREMFQKGKLPYFCINCPFVINGELEMLQVTPSKELYVSLDYNGQPEAGAVE